MKVNDNAPLYIVVKAPLTDIENIKYHTSAVNGKAFIVFLLLKPWSTKDSQ